jgi:hypothetical protein
VLLIVCKCVQVCVIVCNSDTTSIQQSKTLQQAVSFNSQGYGKNHWGTPGFRGWISGACEVHQKLRFCRCELVFILAHGGHLGFGPFFGDPWRTTGTPLTDPHGGAALPPSNDVPGMSPSITKHKQLQNTDFQHSVNILENIRRHSQNCQKY